MSSAALIVAFIGCAAVHLVIAAIVVSPWWVPDLTLVGLILVILRRPQRWVLPAAAAGLFTAAWTIRSPGPIFLGYLIIGWAVQQVARHWDATDLRVQWLLAGTASLGLTADLMWLDDLWSWRLAGLGLVRILLTVLCVPVVRVVMAKMAASAIPSS